MHVRKMALIVLSLILVTTPVAALDASPRGNDDGGSWTAWLGDLVEYVREQLVRVDAPAPAEPLDLGTARPGGQESLRFLRPDEGTIGGGLDPNG